MTFANFLRIFLRFDAFLLKIVYLSIANSRARISLVTHVFQPTRLFALLRLRATRACELRKVT